jgi:hypothetical protein
MFGTERSIDGAIVGASPGFVEPPAPARASRLPGVADSVARGFPERHP